MSDTDWSDFNKLEKDLGEVPENAGEGIATAMGVTSGRIKKDWADKVDGSEGLGGLAASVNYDLSSFKGFGVSVLESEIGYDKSIYQGPLGNISEFGSIKHPARGYGLAALEENADDFEKGQQKAIDDALKAAGL